MRHPSLVSPLTVPLFKSVKSEAYDAYSPIRRTSKGGGRPDNIVIIVRRGWVVVNVEKSGFVESTMVRF